MTILQEVMVRFREVAWAVETFTTLLKAKEEVGGQEIGVMS